MTNPEVQNQGDAAQNLGSNVEGSRATPSGSWQFDEYGVYANIEIAGAGNVVCVAPTNLERSMRQWDTNARLIAAAPALYAALKNLAECSPCQNGCAPNDMECASNQARAALALAQGQDKQI